MDESIPRVGGVGQQALAVQEGDGPGTPLPHSGLAPTERPVAGTQGGRTAVVRGEEQQHLSVVVTKVCQCGRDVADACVRSHPERR